MIAEFYNEKSILITGCTGFIGNINFENLLDL
jgi:FlaA1/EpsC-like NDP-sugar epimerase